MRAFPEIQRRTGVNGSKRAVRGQLIRVVPPKRFGPLWIRRAFLLSKNTPYRPANN